jgi:hypothetical protein
MLDKDGRTEEQVHAAIDWCQDSEFWRGNILSLPKLREKYDQLRLQASRERTPPGARPGAARQRIDEGLERAERMRLLDEAEARGENAPNLIALPGGRTA